MATISRDRVFSVNWKQADAQSDLEGAGLSRNLRVIPRIRFRAQRGWFSWRVSGWWGTDGPSVETRQAWARRTPRLCSSLRWFWVSGSSLGCDWMHGEHGEARHGAAAVPGVGAFVLWVLGWGVLWPRSPGRGRECLPVAVDCRGGRTGETSVRPSRASGRSPRDGPLSGCVLR